jgi:acyl carrier protein
LQKLRVVGGYFVAHFLRKLRLLDRGNKNEGKAIDPCKDLRDQIDIDSVDFLNFVLGLHKELGVDIPDADVPKITTLNGCIGYLVSRVKQA